MPYPIPSIIPYGTKAKVSSSFSCFSFTSFFLITSLWFLTHIEYIQYNLESMKCNTTTKIYYGSSFLPISNLIVHWRCRRKCDLFLFVTPLSRLSPISIYYLNNPLWDQGKSLLLFVLASLSPLVFL